jgi:2-polyprenyl-3-methyl-5-hydroxy-6-metoxy-1,4-benzoquinol methylase
VVGMPKLRVLSEKFKQLFLSKYDGYWKRRLYNHHENRIYTYYTVEYFFRISYFSYRFRAFRAVKRLYEKYFKLIESLTGLRLFDGNGKRALDVGCAIGVETRWLASLGYDVVGLDVSEVVNIAKKLSPRLEFIQGDAHLMPFASNSFDLIVAFELFEHLLNPAKFIVELWRLVKLKGIIVIVAASKSFTRPFYDFIHKEEKTHTNLRGPGETVKIFRKVFSNVVMFTRLLLPIPPHLLNRYFVIYNAPEFLADDYILVAWNKIVSRKR